MKKIIFASLFSSLMVFAACNSNGGNNGDDKNQKVTDGAVTHITSDMFRKLVWDYRTDPQNFNFVGDLPVIVDFYADWCRPCKMVSPIMDDLAKDYKGKVRFYKVNTDQEKELATMFNIRSIPAIMFVPKTGKPSMAVGAQSKESYVQAIKEVLMVK